MGMRLRKSINLGGGFRINLSKSGIGYSWGVPGYRVTKTARGNTRTTYSIPGTGVGYVTEKHGNKSGFPTQKPPKSAMSQASENYTDLDSGDIANYQTSSYKELLDAIKTYKKYNFVANILMVSIVLLYNPLFMLTAIIGCILKVYVKTRLSIPIEYTFDTESKTKYDEMYLNWKTLNDSSALWQLITSATVENKKQNAGADRLVTRQSIKILISTPKFFKTDMTFIMLKLKKEKIYLMPDKILIEQGKKIGAISYEEISIKGMDYPFIETQSTPRDTQVIGQTWLKVNKNGSPDKRFKGNRQVPICKYGLIKLASDSGMNIQICCSNNSLIGNFK